VTPEVGRAIIADDFEQAVDLYLGMPGENMTKDVAEFRAKWLKSKDAEATLEIAPKHLGYEKSILEVLRNRPDDWVKAFRALPPSLQLLMIHSLQSLAFNHALANRLEAGIDLIEPEIGDLVAPVHDNGRIEVAKMASVSATNLERCRRNCRLGRLAVTGPLPGRQTAFAQGEVGALELKALEQTDLTDVDWRVRRIPRLTTSGTRRPLTVSFRSFSVEQAPAMPEDGASTRWDEGPNSGDRWHQNGADLRLRFTLPPGTYATVLMREFMHSPLDHY
jgi:tRNA pseudouridine13 synthase